MGEDALDPRRVVTSGSPRSSKDAPDARFVLVGLTLNDPFDVVTACLKIWY